MRAPLYLRYLIPLLTLVLSLIWFNDHLHLLPTRGRVTSYIQDLASSGNGKNGTQQPAESSALTGTIPPSSPIRTTTATPAGQADASTQVPPTTEISTTPASEPSESLSTQTGDKIIVMGKLKTEDTSWVAENLPDWQNAIYHVDERNPGPILDHAPFLTTSKNKGHEALPYLTYIIDHYDDLPSTIAFVHSHENGWPKAWHTDATGYSNVNSLRTLNIDFVQKTGYANLRCISTPGCPDEIQPARQSEDADHAAEHAYAGAWKFIFQDDNVPDVVAAPCCAQFAVSKGQVRGRSREFYERAREWLLATELDDATSGRVFEYMWHVIFGREAV